MFGWGLVRTVTGGQGQVPVVAALCVAGMLAGAAPAVMGLRMAFTVTTDGLEVATATRTRRIPWPEVGVIRISRATFSRGATEVVTKDGRSIVVHLTAARAAIRRGERTSDHGHDLLQPSRPTRAAMDAHTRHLRGEFGGQR
ncbi:hypothetical protein GCM10028815_09720 [Mariniluteicoccus flavus]